MWPSSLSKVCLIFLPFTYIYWPIKWSSYKSEGISSQEYHKFISFSCGLSWRSLMFLILVDGLVWFMVLNHLKQYFSYIEAETRENHWPVASHWQTLSHNVVSRKPCLRGIRTHNFSGESLIAQVVGKPTTIQSRPQRPPILLFDNIKSYRSISCALFILVESSLSVYAVFYTS